MKREAVSVLLSKLQAGHSTGHPHSSHALYIMQHSFLLFVIITIVVVIVIIIIFRISFKLSQSNGQLL